MSGQDEAARQAAELLPCIDSSDGPCDPSKDPRLCFACGQRPAVAAALRERDEKIAEMNQHFDNLCELESDALRQCHERIAALEAENERLRAALENVPHLWTENGEPRWGEGHGEAFIEIDQKNCIRLGGRCAAKGPQ